MNGEADLLIIAHVKVVRRQHVSLYLLRTRKGLWVVELDLLVEKTVVFPLDKTTTDTLGKVLDMCDKAVVADGVLVCDLPVVETDNA